MSGNNPILIKLINNYPSTIHVNDQPIHNGEYRCYELQLPFIQAIYTDTAIQITLAGTEIDQITPAKGMCFCLTPDTAISLILTESIQINLKQTSGDGDPGGVRCGE